MARMLAIVLFLTVAGCATRGSRHTWQSAVAQDHPLVGQIWDVTRQQRIEQQASLVAIFCQGETIRVIILAQAVQFSGDIVTHRS